MKISADQIEKRTIAGTTKDGNPIVYVITKGGLHAFFSKSKDGEIETLAAAPHRAIAKWLAEKRSPDISWKEVDLEKAEIDLFQRVRNVVFSKPIDTPAQPERQSYLVYNIAQCDIEVMTKSEIEANLTRMNAYALVKDLSLTKPVELLKNCTDFKKESND
jgi:hypothetical protein